MRSLWKGFGKKEDTPSLLSNPFSKEKVSAIHIHMYPSSNNINGSVEFENGLTEGKQKFNADSFDVLVNQMHNFIETL